MVSMQGESSQVGTAPYPRSSAEIELCFEQVLRLKQSTVIHQMALLRTVPAQQLLPAPADHLTLVTWQPLKRSTLKRSPERVRTCLITYEVLSQELAAS